MYTRVICDRCSGSGEGAHESVRCAKCRGDGETQELVCANCEEIMHGKPYYVDELCANCFNELRVCDTCED